MAPSAPRSRHPTRDGPPAPTRPAPTPAPGTGRTPRPRAPTTSVGREPRSQAPATDPGPGHRPRTPPIRLDPGPGDRPPKRRPRTPATDPGHSRTQPRTPARPQAPRPPGRTSVRAPRRTPPPAGPAPGTPKAPAAVWERTGAEAFGMFRLSPYPRGERRPRTGSGVPVGSVVERARWVPSGDQVVRSVTPGHKPVGVRPVPGTTSPGLQELSPAGRQASTSAPTSCWRRRSCG